MDFTGRCRRFDADGGLLGEVAPQGALRLSPGGQEVRFACAVSPNASPRAEVTLALRGAPLPDARRAPLDRRR